MDKPSQFTLFRNHLDLAEQYWKRLIQPGDIVIDATCGNGKDTLRLTQLALQNGCGKLYACDIQEEAIEQTRQFLSQQLSQQQFQQIQFILGCHSNFPHEIEKESVRLVVYNLGYLPGGNKQITTLDQSTLLSLKNAEKLIMPGGAISITCYPGHSEGEIEEKAIIAYLKDLSPECWNVCFHQWINRKKAPSLILIQNCTFRIGK